MEKVDAVGSRVESKHPKQDEYVVDFDVPRHYQQLMQQFSAYYLSKPFLNICKAPLARLTILSQVQGMHGVMSKPSLFCESSRILKEEGLKGFWKGNLASIVRRPPLLAIEIGSTHCLFNFLKPIFGLDHCPEEVSSKREDLLWYTSLSMSHVVSNSAVYPMDLVRARLAAQRSEMYYNGIWHAFGRIYREEGLLGLYKGNGASVLRKAPKLAMNCYTYHWLTSFWESQRPDDSASVRTFSSIALCGLISSMTTFPIDVVRRRLQLDGLGGQARIYNNTGLFGTFRHIIKKEGVGGLYKGVFPNFLKVFPRAGLFFTTLEILRRKDLFSSWVPED